jgi:hypothetical protein
VDVLAQMMAALKTLLFVDVSLSDAQMDALSTAIQVGMHHIALDGEYARLTQSLADGWCRPGNTHVLPVWSVRRRRFVPSPSSSRRPPVAPCILLDHYHANVFGVVLVLGGVLFWCFAGIFVGWLVGCVFLKNPKQTNKQTTTSHTPV